MPFNFIESTEAVGRRLRALRMAKGVDQQKEFAELVGSTANAWNNYENGVRRIAINEALRVCTVTGVSLDFIYRGLETTLPPDLIKKLREAETRLEQGNPRPARRRRVKAA